MPFSKKKTRLQATLKEANEVFRFASKKTKILSTLSWGAKAAIEFLKREGGSFTSPPYNVDRDGLTVALKSLIGLGPKIAGEHPVLQWLQKTQESLADGIRMLLEIETLNFYELSSRLYGNSQSKTFDGKTSNLELARSISKRMSVCALNDISESFVLISAEEFAAQLERKLADRKPVLPVTVELTTDLAAKVAAGMNRVRIRKDARFSEFDVRALWNHEIESHCLTAHNGSLQENCDFLYSGGPRTTMTQEGLAVFFEIYDHTMSQKRFLALCDRVEAISMAERGASFVDLFRWYKERSDDDMEAFYSTQRVFRGAKLDGGAPFTKDVVYLAGLLGIYNFLRLAVKNQNRILIESLVCGRISLEDVGVIAFLRTNGIVRPPYYEPRWLQNWEALLSFFSFSACLDSVALPDFKNYFDEHTLENWDLSL